MVSDSPAADLIRGGEGRGPPRATEKLITQFSDHWDKTLASLSHVGDGLHTGVGR